MLRFVAPSVVMMIFTSIYNVVDGFFVSHFVGKVPFAAINLMMPLFISIKKKSPSTLCKAQQDDGRLLVPGIKSSYANLDAA